jgi:hypothetical protein
MTEIQLSWQSSLHLQKNCGYIVPIKHATDVATLEVSRRELANLISVCWCLNGRFFAPAVRDATLS